MNLGAAKTRAIQLINEYSNNGSLISDTKNADYRLRMNNLADYAQNEISDKVGIDSTYTINDETTITATEDGYKKYDLPEDLKEFRFARWASEPFYDYRIEDRQFWIYEAYTGTFVLVYHKYPATIDDDTDDDYEFDVDSYAHGVIPYYLGGMVLADENANISDKLLNIYYERLGKLYKRTLRAPKTVRLSTRWW